MEHLAAEGWELAVSSDDAEQNSLPEAIEARFDQSEWEAVCLLGVGQHANEADFVDTLFELFTAEGSHE